MKNKKEFYINLHNCSSLRKTKQILIIFLFLIATQLSINGQVTNPEYNDAFLQNEVASVWIEIEQESIDFILHPDSAFSNYEFPARFIYQSSLLTDTIENIGFRLRGNTSRLAAKKSFKVSFNSFENGRKWNGLKKLNLNGEHNDVSIMRSKICWDLLREAGLTASRTSYVKLYINEEYKGLYLNVEHINDDFVRKRYSHGQGNLYKCTYPADLNFLGENSNAYDINAYELKTNEWSTDTYDELRDLVVLLEQGSTAEIACGLNSVINVREYIKHLAAEVLIGHWDGYAFNKNNFYLYHNRAQSRLEWMAYDLDNTLGIDWFINDVETRNIYDWANDFENRPLINAILENEQWRSLFTYEINRLISDHFNAEIIGGKINFWQDLISPAVEEDTYYTLDYGFTHTDFLNSATESWGDHVMMGILDYIEARASSALNQLENVQEPEGISFIDDSTPIINTSNISFLVNAETVSDSELILHYSFDDISWFNTPLIALSETTFTADVLFDEEVELFYYLEYNSNTLNQSLPCNYYHVPLVEDESELVINEIMANNDETIADESGKFEDWVEIYNPGSPLWLGSLYLTDDITFPNQWKLPEFTFNQNDFALLWADDDPEESPFHTNFKLDNNGDQLFLIRPKDDGYQIIDQISFGSQENDISYGRESDAAENWILFGTSTPNSSNNSTFIDEHFINNTVYPNPTRDLIYLKIKSDWKLYDVTGNLYSQGYSNQVDLSYLKAGTYVISVNNVKIRVIKL